MIHNSKMKLFALAVCALTLSACTERPHPLGKPVAQQTYDYVAPMSIDVSDIAIEQRYDLDQYPGDISASLVLPPHVAILDFAKSRYQAKGQASDIFRFVLERAIVTKRVIPQANPWVGWTGLADEDEYRFQIIVQLYRVSPGFLSGPGVRVKMDRTLIIPQRKSLAEVEQIQTDFVNTIIRDLDKQAATAIRSSLQL